MKKKRNDSARTSAIAPSSPASLTSVEGNTKSTVGVPLWIWVAAFFTALAGCWAAYRPALHGEFLFDDIALPFRAVPDYANWSISQAMTGVRPLVGLSYWISFHAGEGSPLAFHTASLLFHAGSGVLLGYILLRIMTICGWGGVQRGWLAVLGSGIFLLHPVQTEAVAYITSHSETLCAFFYFAALATFVSRKEAPIGWPTAIITLLCFGLAMLSKEQALTLPALLILLDLAVYQQSLTELFRNGWRLYALLAAGGVFGVTVVLKTLSGATTAGFAMKDLQWWEYLLTQGRAILLYLRLYVLPVDQNGDYLFPISRGPFEHGAILWWILLLAGLAVALRYRKQAPLIALGYGLFLLILTPTSSILPIQDAAVERRVYLASFGLVIATIGVLLKLKLGTSLLRYGGIALLALLALMTFNRSQVWASGDIFWQDVIAKNPKSWRANVSIGLQALEANRCDAALQHFETARPGLTDNFRAAWFTNYARALDCLGRDSEAEKAFLDSLAVERMPSTLSQLGVFYGKRQQYQEALGVLNEAIERDRNFPLAYSNRGNVYARLGNCGVAEVDFQRALELMPSNSAAQRGLAYCRERQGR